MFFFYVDQIFNLTNMERQYLMTSEWDSTSCTFRDREAALIRISKPMFPQHMLEGNLYETIKENQQARWEPKGMKQSVLWMKGVSQGSFSREVKQTPNI